MPAVSEPPRAVFTAAAETLAEGVVRALNGADNTFALSEYVSAGDSLPGLAAIRILGPDVLAPYILAGYPFTGEAADILATSRATFPTPHQSDGQAPAPGTTDGGPATDMGVSMGG